MLLAGTESVQGVRGRGTNGKRKSKSNDVSFSHTIQRNQWTTYLNGLTKTRHEYAVCISSLNPKLVKTNSRDAGQPFHAITEAIYL